MLQAHTLTRMYASLLLAWIHALIHRASKRRQNLICTAYYTKVICHIKLHTNTKISLKTNILSFCHQKTHLLGKIQISYKNEMKYKYFDILVDSVPYLNFKKNLKNNWIRLRWKAFIKAFHYNYFPSNHSLKALFKFL